MSKHDLSLDEDSPLFYKYLSKIKISKEKKTRRKSQELNIKHYQTDSLIPFSHYKPISKIIVVNDENR